MLIRDNIYNIAIYCDFKTTINLILVLPDIDNENLWREKVNNLNKTYYNFYSGPENYLLHVKSFCLSYSFKTHDNMDPYLYEYTPMLERVLGSVNSHSDHYLRSRLILINDIKQYILLGIFETVGRQVKKNLFYLGSFDTEQEAFDVVDDKPNDNKNDFVIVNIQYLTPSFIHYNNKIKQYEYNAHWKMYDKYKNII